MLKEIYFLIYHMSLNPNDLVLYNQIIDNFDNLKYSLLDLQTFDNEHFGFPELYYKIMETDNTRVNAFVKAFAQYDNLKDAVVCEAGVGRLALTKHYLPYVKKAYLIENNPELRAWIEEEIGNMWYADKVELIFDDATKVILPEQVDFIIWELMSIYCANEFQVQIFKHLRQFLKPSGKLLPEKIINIAQLCHAEFEYDHKHYPLNFTRHLPELLSLPEVINTLDLYTVENIQVELDTKFNPLLNGIANAIYMQSFVQVSSNSNFTGTDSLMPPTVCKLENSILLEAADVVTLSSKFQYGTSLDKAIFSLS